MAGLKCSRTQRITDGTMDGANVISRNKQMTKAELDQAEREINIGLSAAHRVIDAVVAKQKAECPGLPDGSIRMAITRGNTNDVAVALFLIEQHRQREAA